eukprot:506589_1
MAHWLKYGSYCQVIVMYGSCKPNNISICSNIKRREFSKLLLLYTPALHLPLLTCTCFFFILYVFCCVYVLLLYTPALHLPLLTCTCFFFILYVFCCVYVLLMT